MTLPFDTIARLACFTIAGKLAISGDTFGTLVLILLGLMV